MSSTYLTQELKETLTFVLAGGQGERLKPLTLHRAKPAVPFGGCYRIIDFTLSNCIHSGLRRIYVLTQYQARSLEEHIRFGWNFLPRRLEQFISVSPPHHATVEKWYQGTADAIYQNLDMLEDSRARHVLILSGDHIYKMDYGLMLRQHLNTGAALTIGAVRIPAGEARRFGIFEVDAEGRVRGFQEKPQAGREIPGQPGWCLGSMGIYVFEADELIRRLRADAARVGSSHDFGKDVIPSMIGQVPVQAHRFVDRDNPDGPYWRDVGTIDAYYEANMDLVSVAPHFNLYDTGWPIYSLWHADPPAKAVFDEPGRRSDVTDSLLCPGVVVSGARVRRSLLSNRVHVEEGAVVEDSILFGGVRVGRGARIRRAILDKWNVVPEGAVIGHEINADDRRFAVTPSGITVVPSRYDFGGQTARPLEFSAHFPRPGE
jgi:glucose-1-phosphate adenylyltransferase